MPESTNCLIFLFGQIKNKTLTVIMLAAASLFQKISQYLEMEGTLTVSSSLGTATLSPLPKPSKKEKRSVLGFRWAESHIKASVGSGEQRK